METQKRTSSIQVSHVSFQCSALERAMEAFRLETALAEAHARGLDCDRAAFRRSNGVRGRRRAGPSPYGPWDTRQSPFARAANVAFDGERWRDDISHCEDDPLRV